MKTLFFVLLFFCQLAFGDAVIFSGNDVKTLKFNIDLFGRSKLLGLAADPTGGAGQAAPLGSIGMNYLTGIAYLKVGAGNTQWEAIRSGLVDLTTEVTGVLPLANGGSGANLTAVNGAMIYSDANSFEVGAVGSANQLLQSTGAGPYQWTTATYPATAGAPCSLLANTSDVITCLDASTANRVLRTNGSALSFSQVVLSSDVSGVLPLANGGTNNITVASQGGLAYGTASGISLTAASTSGQVWISQGTAAPVTYNAQVGALFYGGTSGVVSQNANYLFWDAANERLSVGVNANTINSFTVNGTTKGSVFTVEAQGGTNEYEMAVRKSSATLWPQIAQLRARGSGASPSIVQNGDILSQMDFLGFDGTDYEYGAKIDVVVDGTPGTNDMPSAIRFWTVADGTSTPVLAASISQDRTFSIYGTLDTALTVSGVVLTNSAGIISSASTLALNAGGTANNISAINGGVIYSTASAMSVTAAGVSGQILISQGSSAPIWSTAIPVSSPTIQRFTSGSGTYTTPAGVRWIRIRAVAGGGGGGGSGTSGNTAGGGGGSTSFGSITANGGAGGTVGTGGSASTNVAGGTIASGSPNVLSGQGNGGSGTTEAPGAPVAGIAGGLGGTGFFGGGPGAISGAGVAAIANSGAGGGGGGGNTSTYAAGGGGAGAFFEHIITSPAASYSYAVGAGGTAGSAGTSGLAGGAGGSGLIIVEEYYQ